MKSYQQRDEEVFSGAPTKSFRASKLNSEEAVLEWLEAFQSKSLLHYTTYKTKGSSLLYKSE